MSIFWAISAGLFAASAAVAVAWWWLELRRAPRPDHVRIARSVAEAFAAQATPLAAPVVRRSNPRSGYGYSPPVDPESTADFPSLT